MKAISVMMYEIRSHNHNAILSVIILIVPNISYGMHTVYDKAVNMFLVKLMIIS